MTSSWIDGFAKKLIDNGLAIPETIQGCSDHEIASIEAAFKVKLPLRYVEFLQRMGKDAGEFLGECSLTYNCPSNYSSFSKNRSTAELLLKNSKFRLAQSAFVFCERYGCQFFFFDTSQGQPDPPVYRFMEGQEAPTKISDSLTGALDMALEDQLMDLNPDPEFDRPYKFAI